MKFCIAIATSVSQGVFASAHADYVLLKGWRQPAVRDTHIRKLAVLPGAYSRSGGLLQKATQNVLRGAGQSMKTVPTPCGIM